MVQFETILTVFVKQHVSQAQGERRRRLQAGLGYAEKLFLELVWWPSVGCFDYLIPEFELQDYKDGTRFLDFVYVRSSHRICFEIDGYGPHLRNTDRWSFADQLMRQNHLVLDGWKVIRFSVDDIKEKPRRCQQLLQQIMGRWFSATTFSITLDLKEREIVRLALNSQEPINCSAVCAQLGVSRGHARILLLRLEQKRILEPASGKERVTSYRLRERHMLMEELGGYWSL